MAQPLDQGVFGSSPKRGAKTKKPRQSPRFFVLISSLDSNQIPSSINNQFLTEILYSDTNAFLEIIVLLGKKQPSFSMAHFIQTATLCKCVEI